MFAVINFRKRLSSVFCLMIYSYIQKWITTLVTSTNAQLVHLLMLPKL